MMRRKMTTFLYYSGDGSVIGNPSGSTDDPYNFLRAVWRDGRPMTLGDNGYGGTVTTSFMFSGDPVQRGFWSEVNTDGFGGRNWPSDRRFILSTGPFDLDPGDTQDIVVAIVWAQGKDYLDSVVELKEAACVAQHAVNENIPCEYVRPAIPLGDPIVLLSPANGVTGQPVNVTVFWKSAPIAFAYEVQFASNPGFDGGTLFTTARPDTSVTLQLDADTPYWWRVRARFPGDLAGPWAEVGTFSTGAASVFPKVPYAAADYIASFQVVANAAGPLDPPEQGAFAFEDNGFPLLDGADRPTSRQQVGDGVWGMHTGEGNGPTFDDFGRRSLRNGSRDVVPWDWEIRFTERCRAAWEADQVNPYGAFPADACYAYDRFAVTTDAGDSPMIVPFEVWNTGIGTPDDPSDDFRMVLVGIDWDGDGWNLQCYDHEVSGGDNDPVTDWIYTYLPADNDMSPGEAGYEAWKADLLVGTADHHGSEVMARLVFVNWNGGDVSTCDPRPTFTSEMPEAGTVFRIETAKPIIPILAAPAPGSVIRAGVNRFFWSADGYDRVRVEIRSQAGFSLDSDPSWSGQAVTLTEPGSYTWRAVSSWAGPSAWWPFEVVSTVATEDDDGIPTRVELHPNYPNPFNPSTVIRFGLPEATGVTLEVFDILGRRAMKVLSDAPYAAGYHDVALQMGALASGTYLYRLQAGPVVRHAKMVYVR